MSLKSPNKISNLQRKLYCKAKQEEGFRFYALYDKIYRQDILEHAYRLVHANGGSPGIDGVSSRAIEDAGKRNQFLTKLAGLYPVPTSVKWKHNALQKKDIGKPCTGKPYARFDEGGLVFVSMD